MSLNAPRSSAAAFTHALQPRIDQISRKRAQWEPAIRDVVRTAVQFTQQQEAQVPYDTVQDGYVQQESYGGVRGNAPAGAAVNRAPEQHDLIQMEDGTIYSPRNLMSGLQDLLSHLVRENTELRARNASQAIIIQRDAERYDALQAKYAELSRHNLHVSRKHEEQAKTIEKMTQEQARLRERNGEEVRLLPIRVNREAKVYITVEES